MTECLLCYLENEDSDNILKWTNEYFAQAPFICLLNFEMIEPFDSFGQTMINNLRERGCDLLGLEGCPTVAAQIQRMNTCWGTNHVECETMEKVYREKLDAEERKRIEKLEMFDEFEEWVLLQSHYCLCFSKRFEANVEA